MHQDQYLGKLLNDFVFLDSRLADHGMVRASVLLWDGGSLRLVARSPSTKPLREDMRIRPGIGIAGVCFQRRKFAFVKDYFA